MRHVKWAVVVGLVALAVGAVGALQAQQQLSGEYKIGVLEPLTGNLAAEGKRHLEGYEIVRDLINERFGGVMGKKLVFVIGDAVDPTVAASEATRLATREGVKIITGTFSSTLCGAASEAASRQNVIYWETSCVDPRLTRRGLKNVFRTEIDGTGFGWYNVEFIAKHLAHRLGKKPNELRIAYLSEDSSYGQSVTESARQRAKQEFGMQEVAARVLHVHHQRPHAGHPQAQERQPRHPAPHRAQPGRHPLLAAGARAELPGQGGRARRARPATARPTSARPSATTPTAPSRCSSPARASSSRRCGPRASGSSARSARR